MIKYTIEIDDGDLKTRLMRFDQDRPELNRKILNQVGLQVVAKAQRNLRGGNPLNVGTGRLWNSVTHRVAKSSVWVGTNVFYGRVHETGKTRAGKRVIKPVKKSFLYIPLHKGARIWRPSFVFGEDFVLARQVKIVKRPWLRPAINSVLAEGAHVRIGSQVYKVYFQKEGLQ